MFTNGTGGHLAIYTVYRDFKNIVRSIGCPNVRFHDLRHTCAGLLLKNGVSMKEVQEWLSHSNFSTTANIYAHLDTSSKNTSAARMNESFSISPGIRPGLRKFECTGENWRRELEERTGKKGMKNPAPQNRETGYFQLEQVCKIAIWGRGTPKWGPHESALQLLWGEEPQQNERAVAFEKSRRKRYDACGDVVPVAGLEPARLAALDFESSTSTNSITPAGALGMIPRFSPECKSYPPSIFPNFLPRPPPNPDPPPSAPLGPPFGATP